MRRRDFVNGIASSAIFWPLSAQAQGSLGQRLIGFLDGKSQPAGQALTNNFLLGLRELGYDDGRNINILYRFADGHDERLPSLANELVQLKPSLIVAPGVNAAVAAKDVTTTIPIVSWALADAVHLGLVKSYARPGGNVTGITPYVDGLPGKQMEFAREVLPGARKIGLLGNMNDPKGPPQRQELENIARSLKVESFFSDVTVPEDLPRSIRMLASERVDIVIVLQTGMTLSERRAIGALMLENRLPAVFGYRENVVDGGLISYGVDLRWCSHRVATFVHKIFNGTPPGDLPIEFPTKLQLAINLKTANELGLTLPAPLLIRADEVIE